MSAADQTDPSGAADGGDSLWSGAPVTPGSEMVPAAALAFLVFAVPAVLIGALLFGVLPVLPWWLGALLGVIVAVVAVSLLAERADRSVLATLGSAVPEARHPERLVNMVDGLTLAGGVIAPSIVVLDDPARNALAVRRRDRNHVVFTTGLVEGLDVVGLEAAVAELLTRLRNGDAEAATLGAALIGRPLIDGPLGALFGPVASGVLSRLLPPDRDLEADRQAVTLTRYPPGLINALESLQGHRMAPTAASGGTAHLWLVDPGPGQVAAGDETRAPLSLRIDALAEL